MKHVELSLQTKYRQEYDYCEACARLNGVYPVRLIELHHIYGGDSRTDEWWNYISVCREHHERGTTHSLKFGSDSRDWNNTYLAIKLLKGEIAEAKLIELKVFEEVSGKIKYIVNSLKYHFGLRCGYYKDLGVGYVDQS